MSAPLLAVEAVSKLYAGGGLFGRRPPLSALDRVSLTVDAGQIHGIVGESGSGKSTLARIVTALERPSSGRVLLGGDDLHGLPAVALRARRRDIQMVFQDPYGSLDPRQRVGRIVAEPLHLVVPKLSRAERTARVESVLESVGLAASDAMRRPHEFSGGQRQRIAIARALITRPKLLVADEAVSALDLSVQAQILNLLLDLSEREGLAILFISHNLSAVAAIADVVSVMYRGRVVETGPSDAIFSDPRHPYTRALALAEPALDRPQSLRRQTAAARDVVSDGPAETGCHYRSACLIAAPICAEEPLLRQIDPNRRSACHFAEALGSKFIDYDASVQTV
ncbi:oligopeptide/dipeptide ABC transporter ATP-binding protein [Aurantimonas endophytica]|uniref:Peptide/nickel transport system ATP-binding protein n=1 Tax=Aurantimonas endophytica TaxID=1522175 RepID=A0A7W6HEU0_9HYPH|nr:oligopeptide/dipeptide ABC transporter ATP-binding protein [Aurantimonas endophytica]MBB4003909.1 peptide/nickel transport system ATP-binding protein [Aurantimonas endophytica]MCO6404760.1 ATP-binding cassette domain-containing protein [Aurantimonas endophytica]